MSSDIAISVSNLSKCFQIYDKPRDRLKQAIMPKLYRALSLFTNSSISRPDYFREFWALRSVLFEVKKGETVGIIGRNGSGKSTLLQMICGTLTPSSGDIQVAGRVAALLELGAGFNPEFTGRENVYMNGALLGLSKSEIEARFNDIAAFADIGDFMDQPVKSYSSGMYVRLAFSVAVHVDPEILIIDEALAVGDIQFQMQCIDRMEKIRARGTTILFVSHSLEQVKRFCTSAIWLEKGGVRLMGEANFVTDQYRDSSLSTSAERQSTRVDSSARLPECRSLASVISVDVNAKNLAPFESLSVRITYDVKDEPLPKLLIGVAIKDVKGTFVFGPNTYLDKVCIPYTPGSHVVEYVIPRLPLLTGTYFLDVGLFTDGGLVCVDYLGAASEMCVVAEYFCEGLVYIDHEWRTVRHG